MSKRTKDHQPQSEPWQRPPTRRLRMPAEAIIRRARTKHYANEDMVIYEANINQPEKNKEMIERLVHNVKYLGANRSMQPYDDEGWY